MATTAICPSCSSDDLLVVDLVPRDTPVRFSTCRQCEHRWWADVEAGADVGLRSIIDELSGASA